MLDVAGGASHASIALARTHRCVVVPLRPSPKRYAPRVGSLQVIENGAPTRVLLKVATARSNVIGTSLPMASRLALATSQPLTLRTSATSGPNGASAVSRIRIVVANVCRPVNVRLQSGLATACFSSARRSASVCQRASTCVTLTAAQREPVLPRANTTVDSSAPATAPKSRSAVVSDIVVEIANWFVSSVSLRSARPGKRVCSATATTADASTLAARAEQTLFSKVALRAVAGLVSESPTPKSQPTTRHVPDASKRLSVNVTSRKSR